MSGETSARRRAGVMLPVASLPSRYGIGDLGAEAYQFVDMLFAAGARYWQILPINPLGYGNSPYQPYSSYAGDPIFISLDALHAEGLLKEQPDAFRHEAEQIDYGAVRKYKDGILRKAYEAFAPDAEYDAFIQQGWVRDYAVFMAFKRANGMQSWNGWPAAQRNWPYQRTLDLAPFEEIIGYEMFLQYVFYRQWMKLKQYANDREILIIGDIPIYVGIDSQDVWTSRESFLLDSEGVPTSVAGVPPDYFSATGQRWGNPIYNWTHLEQDGFAFWIDRLRYSSQLFDVIRIDHFRGFDTYWEIPASCPTAEQGEWKEAPGYALFDRVMGELPGIVIIAEDLGMLRDEVYVLRDHYHFRGMKILQFTFDAGQKQRPREDNLNMVVYTGTHDNETTRGWYEGHAAGWKIKARLRLFRDGYRRGSITQRFVRLALDNAADMAVIPAQDILGLDDKARINTPGTVGSPNWEWKLKDFIGLDAAMPWFGQAIRDSERL